MSYAITLLLSMEELEPHAPTATGVNEFEHFMRHGQAAHCRTQVASPSDVSGWLDANFAETWVCDQYSFGCSASDTPAAQNSLFPVVNRVLRAVTPKLASSMPLHVLCFLRGLWGNLMLH